MASISKAEKDRAIIREWFVSKLGNQWYNVLLENGRMKDYQSEEYAIRKDDPLFRRQGAPRIPFG